MIDMTKWQKIAAENVNKRDMAPGRLSGKIAIVTGSAQGLARELSPLRLTFQAKKMLQK